MIKKMRIKQYKMYFFNFYLCLLTINTPVCTTTYTTFAWALFTVKLVLIINISPKHSEEPVNAIQVWNIKTYTNVEILSNL